jgi:hypothetical protein
LVGQTSAWLLYLQMDKYDLFFVHFVIVLYYTIFF